MFRIFVTVVLLVLSLTACTTTHKQVDTNPAFSQHQYDGADLAISWKSEMVDNAMRIEGTVTNVRQNYVYDNLELDATLMDLQGKVIAKQTYNFTPVRLVGTEAFKMTVPLEKNMRPESIKFNYRYGIDEDHYSIKFVSKP